MKVLLADTKITDYHKKLINEVLTSGRFTYGPKTKEFEEKFAKLHGRKYAIFTNSGTSALQVSLHYLKDFYGWRDDDEIIVPSVTFVATVNVVLLNRLKPVVVDVNRNTFNMAPELIEKKITNKTRAILPVHLLGQPAKMDEIMRIARKYKLKVVEDSCEAMFVKYADKYVGAWGDIGCFSSYLAHIISTGVGGFITTDNKRDAEAMRSMIWHGRDNLYLSIDDNKNAKLWEIMKARFRFNRVGYSYRLTELEAALGLAELKTWRENIRQRQQNAKYLTQKLQKYDHLFQLPYAEKAAQHCWMFYPIVVQWPIYRDIFAQYLEKKGIQTRWIMPLTNQPVYENWMNNFAYPNADYINDHGILLGCHQFLTKEHLDYIVSTIEEYLYESL